MGFVAAPPEFNSPNRRITRSEFEIAVGEAAQNAVWNTEHPLTHHLAEDDPLRVQYLRDYQQSVGRQVLATIIALSAAACRTKHNQGLRASLVDPGEATTA